MRILVVGPGVNVNTALACHVLRTIHSELPSLKYNVITSYTSSLDLFAACPNVSDVTAFKDLKDDETDPSQGLVVDVLASSFFDKPWVKQRLRESTDLVVVSASPVTLMDKSTLEKFDRVYITKTIASDKQSQYYTLFVDTTRQTFSEFKKIVKGIVTSQYVRVTMEHGKPGPLVVESYSAPWDHGINTETAHKEGQSGNASAVAAAPSTQRPPPARPVTLDRPKDTVEPGKVELWLTMTVSKDVTLDDVTTNLRMMLGNDVVASMLHESLYHSVVEEHRLNVYVQVFEQRQDLFAALALNMLLSLRVSNIITQGSISL